MCAAFSMSACVKQIHQKRNQAVLQKSSRPQGGAQSGTFAGTAMFPGSLC